MTLDLEEIWLKINEASSIKIWDGVNWTHPTLSDGNKVVYHPIFRNNFGKDVKCYIEQYINGAHVATVTADVPDGSQIPIWLPSMSGHIVEGVFKTKAKIFIDDVYLKTFEIEWNGTAGTFREYVNEEPEPDEVPETIFDAIWAKFLEFSEQLGLPVPPKPQLPPLPFITNSTWDT